jgi:RNA polymerase sigma factor (sigma-70 family)
MRFISSGRKSEKSDEELLSEYRRSRDMRIIGELFDRYSHLVFAVSMNYLKDEENSKDAVIHIFEKLPDDIAKYSIRKFSSWLHSVTRNHCLRIISKANSLPLTHPDDLSHIADHATDDMELPSRLNHLEAALDKLNEEQRKCIELFYIEEYSYQQITTMTGFTLNQVKSHIQNGKRNLKIILSKRINEDR